MTRRRTLRQRWALVKLAVHALWLHAWSLGVKHEQAAARDALTLAVSHHSVAEVKAAMARQARVGAEVPRLVAAALRLKEHRDRVAADLGLPPMDLPDELRRPTE